MLRYRAVLAAFIVVIVALSTGVGFWIIKSIPASNNSITALANENTAAQSLLPSANPLNSITPVVIPSPTPASTPPTPASSPAIATVVPKAPVPSPTLSPSITPPPPPVTPSPVSTVGSSGIPLNQEAADAVHAFTSEAMSWGVTHAYHDNYNGVTYFVDNSYINTKQTGTDYTYNTQSSALQSELQTATTSTDFQNVINNATTDMVELKALEADYGDATPYNQVHQADITVVQYYEQHYYPQMATQQIIVVSLAEQTLRVYQPGMQLQNAFRIISGEDDHPSPTGVWNVLWRLSPTTFNSPFPLGSAGYYPPTPINYAMEFHDGGFFLHSAWWRTVFGPDDQFPHVDAGGTTYAINGSHGCINLPDNYQNPNPSDHSDAEWLYSNTTYNTVVVIY